MAGYRCVVFAILCAGCQTAGEGVADRDIGDRLIEVREHMHARFAATNSVRMSIAYGDLERAKRDAQTVAMLDEPRVLPEWKPYVDNVRAAASELARSTNLTVAAKQLAILGWRCAQCHQTVPGTRTAFPKAFPPPDDQKLIATMAGHDWATARMWEGLVGPSDARWTEGATSLANAPLTITAEGEVPGHELGIADDVSRIRLLATRAQKTQTAFDRAEVYGQLLATCARCHFAIRDR